MEASLEDCAGVRLVRFPAVTDARGGWIGCLRSHLSCMLQRMRGAPLVFVLEDDNVFNAPATLGAELGALQAWLLGHLGEWDAFTGSARIGRLPRDCDSAARGFALLDRDARIFRTTVAYGSSFVVYNAALLPWAAAWLARLESGSGRFAESRDAIDRILPRECRTISRLPFLSAQRDCQSFINKGVETITYHELQESEQQWMALEATTLNARGAT